MPIIAKASAPEFTRERVPSGTHQAVCQSVHDIGMQAGEFQGERKIAHKIVVVWEVNERIAAGKFAGQRFIVSKKYTLSLHEKATLRHDLASWRGRDFTDEEAQGFDVEKLIGANCLLSITEKETNGKTYTNISAVTALPKGMEKIKPELPVDHKYEWIDALKAKAVNTDDTDELPADDSGRPSDKFSMEA